VAEPDYIVIRPSADLPPDISLGRFDGLWIDRATLRERPIDVSGPAWGEQVAVPTGRFEVREDGAVAEVWEVAP
jgi:hypothetical protein